MLLLILNGILLHKAPLPFVWIFGLWFVWFGVMATRASSRVLKLGLLNVSVLFLLLAGVEGVLNLMGDPSRQHHYPDRYTTSDPILGQRPSQGGEHSMEIDGEVVYTSRYTFDEHHWRIMPEPTKDDAPGIVIFGCSFAYGEGVNDHENFPYILGEQLKDRYRTVNLSFHGYGPNHMLACLDNGLTEAALEGSVPQTVIYFAIPDHVGRAVGHTSWSGLAPRYLLDDNDTLVQQGTFYDWTPLSKSLWFRARILKEQSAVGRLVFPYTVTADDQERWLSIVETSRERVLSKWPDARFVVVFWDEPKDAKLTELLRAKRFEVHRLVESYPDLDDYTFPGDSHPNPHGHRVAADFILAEVLAEEAQRP